MGKGEGTGEMVKSANEREYQAPQSPTMNGTYTSAPNSPAATSPDTHLHTFMAIAGMR